jgi:hypothetical protein
MKKTAAPEQNERPLSFFSGWKYAPAPESTDHISLKKQYGLFINGEFVPPVSKKYFDTINPAREQKIAEIAEANEKDVDRASHRSIERIQFRLEKDCSEGTRQIYLPYRQNDPGTGSRTGGDRNMDGGNRSVSRVMSMYPSPRIISSIMPVGRTNWSMRSPTALPSLSVLPDRSFRGIFRSSWLRGRSLLRSPPVTLSY